MIFVCSCFVNAKVQKGLKEMLEKEKRKPVEASRVLLFVYEGCCGLPYENLYEYKALISCGFKSENITVFDLTKDERIPEGNFDALFVPGGNTFTLLHTIRTKRLEEYIAEFDRNKGLYIGESAGAHIVYSDIEHVRYYDDNNVGLDNYAGLNLIPDSIVLCHFDESKLKHLCELWLSSRNEETKKFDTVFTMSNSEYLCSFKGEKN